MNNIFIIKKISEDNQTFHYQAEIKENHPVFEGHFPEQAVVPGVCTLNMLKQCIIDALNYKIRYDYIKECKFLSLIIPSKHPVLDVKFDIKFNENEINVIAEITSDDEKTMKVKSSLIKI